MRIAYLITAYHQPSHLKRLVDSLDAVDARFHIHIDAQVDASPFHASLAGRANVRFVEPRIAVQWMGFSQVESILLLLRDAALRGFDYCVLLSGSDYPIKTRAAERAAYAGGREELIAFWKLADRPSWLHKIQYLYPIDRIPIRGWAKGTEPSWARRWFWGRYHAWRHRLPRRAFPFDMTPYGGSDWWTLSEGCVRHVLRFVDEHPAYSRFYRYSHCPSEMFFHTIILNSEWRTRVRGWQAYEAWSAGTSAERKRAEDAMLAEVDFHLRYMDWSAERTGARELPAVLDGRDFDRLAASRALFARKFEQGISDAVLDRIDRELLGAGPA